VTVNVFDVRPTCDTADVPAILPFPPNPLKHVLCDVPDCGVDALWKWWDVNMILDETPQEEITHCQVSSFGVTKSSDKYTHPVYFSQHNYSVFNLKVDR